MIKTQLAGVVDQFIRAINASDLGAVLATFADDAFVNDSKREIVGVTAISGWLKKEIIGDNVRIEVREVLEHHGTTILRGGYDGTYDKTNLPSDLVLTNYFVVSGEKIVSLIIIFNQPSPF